jgi:hypothetical protein
VVALVGDFQKCDNDKLRKLYSTYIQVIGGIERSHYHLTTKYVNWSTQRKLASDQLLGIWNDVIHKIAFSFGLNLQRRFENCNPTFRYASNDNNLELW